jgi:DNA-binding transcriptional MerR regulator
MFHHAMMNPTATMGSSMRIGTLAKSVGCHVETVRYYEKEGLIPPAKKAANGYGMYSESHLKVLRLIRNAKDLGFSQIQIRELSHLALLQNRACNEVYQLTKTQLVTIDQKLEDLKVMRKTLKSLSVTCEQNSNDNCPVLERLASK